MKWYTMPDNTDPLVSRENENNKKDLDAPELCEKFRIHLSVFEGPIDLLLYLIKKN